MKNLRKSQAQFREKLRKLRLRQNCGFLIKNVYMIIDFQTLRTIQSPEKVTAPQLSRRKVS